MLKKIMFTALAAVTVASSFVFADTPVINKEIKNQRVRIHQGVKSGKLTPAQAAALKQMDKDIKKEKADMIKTNGGKPLTAEQRKILREDLKKISAKIYAEKHPGETVPPKAAPGASTTPNPVTPPANPATPNTPPQAPNPNTATQ